MIGPVAEPVLEGLRDLGRDQEQKAARRQQAGRWCGGAKARQRPLAEAAQRDDLEQLDHAEGGDGDETDREDPRVEGDHSLAQRQRQRHHGEGGGADRRLAEDPRVAHPHVRLVTPFLAAAHDLVLGRANELAAAPRRAKQSQ